jgi:drug/metabolite transporter (DMT)-like permease
MIFLLLRIFFSTAFSHMIRLSQARTPRPMGAAAINYLIAGIGCSGWALFARQPWHTPTVVLGAVAGVIYVLSMVLLLPAMRESGVSVIGAVTQLSMMLPIGTAILRFGEYPSAVQWVGIGLTLLALPVLASTSAVAARKSRRFSPLTSLLFLSTGGSQVVMKEFSATCPSVQLPLYSAALFVAATASTYGWIAATGDTGRPREIPHRPEGRQLSEWTLGLALGLANTLQLVCHLEALRVLPAVVVFPVSASLGIVFNAAASVLLWKEHPRRSGWLGIALAIVAVILLSRR